MPDFCVIIEQIITTGVIFMNQTLKKVLMGQENNHMLPFFWQHGEDEATLREYMKAIYEANCRAVCVESRPHPDFAGPKWWQDMDVILDEARKRDMKVWILDDSHFPTGYANGALKNYPDSACKQNIFMTEFPSTFMPQVLWRFITAIKRLQEFLKTMKPYFSLLPKMQTEKHWILQTV